MLYAFCLPLSLGAENTSFFIMLGFLLLSGNWREKWQVIKTNPIAWFAVILTAMYLIGCLYSAAPARFSLWIFKKQAELIFIALLIPLFFEQAQWKWRCYQAYIAGAMFVFLLGALNMLGIFNIAAFFHKTAQSPAFPLFFHIYAGSFLAFAAYIAAQLACREGKWRWVYILCFGIISFDVLFMSIARTGYLLYFALMLLLLIQKFNLKQMSIGVISLALLMGLTYQFSATFKDRIDQEIYGALSFKADSKSYSNSSGVRLEFTLKSLELWKQKPLFGYGTGGFAKAYININGLSAGGASLSTASNPQVSPENTFLFIAVEHGLIGLAILLGLLIVEWQGSFKLPDQLERHIAQALVIMFIIASFSAPMLLDESPRLFFVFFSSLLFAPLSKFGFIKSRD
jgi:O-antigen ligase